jgi:ABC-type branched-subunit amino acid transport system ATPase component
MLMPADIHCLISKSARATVACGYEEQRLRFGGTAVWKRYLLGGHMSQQKDHANRVEKITFRLFPPYTEKVAQQAGQARLSPNQFARIATMAMADGELLNLSDKLGRVECELRRLRRDLFADEIVRSSTTH